MRLIWLLFLFFPLCYGARILCVFPTPLYSHQSVFRPIWTALVERGHEVTVITTNPVKLHVKNLHEIDISFSYKIIEEYMKDVDYNQNILSLIVKLYSFIYNLTIKQLQHPEVYNLFKNDGQFDLLIAEAHVPAWFSLMVKYNCPLVITSSMDASNVWRKLMGNFNHPVYNPDVNLAVFADEMTFFQRLASAAFEVFDYIQTLYLFYPLQQHLLRSYMEINVNLKQIAQNASLFLTSSPPGFKSISTKIPSIIELHGLHIKAPRPLPKDIQVFLDEADKGAIYFSLGSNLRSALMTKEKREIFLQIFAELPYKIIWKFEDDVIVNLPDNIKLVKWAPQQDILRHQNTKLFITQAGIQSIEEAIYSKVPMMCVPFYGDQHYNAKAVEKLNIGLQLDIKKLDKNRLRDMIEDLIHNETRKQNLEDISDLLIEQPLKSVDKAVWWIEYVIKYKGASHLKSPLSQTSFYQYFLLDVILFTIMIFLIIVCIFYTIFTGCKCLRTKQKCKYT